MAKKNPTVCFELTGGFTRFEISHDGELVSVGKDGLETDDPHLIGTLDQQGHAVCRTEKSPKTSR